MFQEIKDHFARKKIEIQNVVTASKELIEERKKERG